MVDLKTKPESLKLRSPLRFLLVVLCLGLATSGWAEVEEKDDDKVEPVKVIKGREKTLTVPLGISKTLEFNFEIGPVYLTDGGVVAFQRVQDGSDKIKKLLLIPKNSGSTDMTIFDVNGTPRITYLVRVTREDIGGLMSQLEELLGDIEGLKVKSLAGTIILDGEILLPRDMIRIFRVLDAMKDTRDQKKREVPIRNLATISKLTMNILAERIEREIGSPEITARVVNNNIFLEGTADGPFEADRAIEIARTYLPEVFAEKVKGEGGEVKPKQVGGIGGGIPGIVDLLRLRPPTASPPAQDIKITMNFVELSNDYSRNFNFEWRPLASDQSTVKYDTNAGELTAGIVATISSLLPKLFTARDHGHARILKQQQIIVKDKGDLAIVDSSLQIFTRTVDDKGNSSFLPIDIKNRTAVRAATIAGSDSIELGLQIELSAPAGAPVAGAPPSIARNILQTQVIIKNGESAALGGNAVDQSLSNYNNAPGGGGAQGAGGTPLFNFSRSKSFIRNKSQYIIFVTPEVIRTASAATEDMTRKFRLNAGER